VKIIFTKHVRDKLLKEEIQKLGITEEDLKNVLKNPVVEDKNIAPHQSIGKFNEELSLSVIWKIEKSAIIVITFYPSSKGRYESKILQRR